MNLLTLTKMRRPTGIYSVAGFTYGASVYKTLDLVENVSLGMSKDPEEERGKMYPDTDYWAQPHRRICHCCGAFTAHADEDISRPANGILVSLNNNTPEYQDEFCMVKKINTQCGELSIGVRYAWDK